MYISLGYEAPLGCAGAPKWQEETTYPTLAAGAAVEGHYACRWATITGQVVDVGAPVAVIGEEGEEVQHDLKPAGKHSSQAISDDSPRSQPAAARPATVPEAKSVTQRELGLPIDRSSWSRPHKQSPRSRYAAREAGESWAEILETTVEQAAPPSQRGRRVALNSVRRATVRTVEASWQVPQFAVEAEVNTQPAQRLLADIRLLAPEPHVTLTDLLAAAMARATIDVPAVNAWFEGDATRLFEEVDLSLMVQTERGLYVPVLRDLQAASISRIASIRARAVR